MKNESVDIFLLMIYPNNLGPGERLFLRGARSAGFKVTESLVAFDGRHPRELRSAGAITTPSL